MIPVGIPGERRDRLRLLESSVNRAISIVAHVARSLVSTAVLVISAANCFAEGSRAAEGATIAEARSSFFRSLFDRQKQDC